MKKSCGGAVIAVAGVICMSSTVEAAILVTNFPATADSEVTNASGAQNAQGFLTPATSFSLESVTLVLHGFGGGSRFTLELYSDSGEEMPSNLLVTGFAGGGSITNSTASHTYFPSVPTFLAPSSRYWLVVRSSDSVFWHESTEAASGAASLLPGMRKDGAQWLPTGGHFALRVDATAVPEPATSLLLCAPASLFIATSRFRRRNKSV